MQKFNNPLDHIKIASPCSADWNKMHGNERQRFCRACNLNVYNLSDMTRTEAENFLINSEGRVCVRFYRRRDGTVLTQNCPVGWQRLKKRISRVTTAVFSMLVGLFSGVLAFTQISFNSDLMEKVVVESSNDLNNNQSDNEILIEEGQLTYETPYEPLTMSMGKPDIESILMKKKPNQ